MFLPLLLNAAPFPKSDHYDGDRFFNPDLKDENTLWDVLKWKFTSDAVEWETNIPNKNYPAPILGPEQKALVTFINHSTFLIQLPGMSILTDPLFSDRTGPVNWLGPKRARPPGLRLDQLPKIDVVVISHNHYDHIDLESLKAIDGRFHPLFIVPLGDEKLLKEDGIQNVIEVDWGKETQVRDTKFTFTPAQHWSARGIFDRSKSLWGGYWIEQTGFKIFFAGDTGYSKHFKMIKANYGVPDLALLPIGAYEPRWFMQGHHMNPSEAVMAHLDLGSKISIGMHFGTFKLGDEGREQPIQELEIALTKNDIDLDTFIVLDQGDSKGFLK